MLTSLRQHIETLDQGEYHIQLRLAFIQQLCWLTAERDKPQIINKLREARTKDGGFRHGAQS